MRREAIGVPKGQHVALASYANRDPKIESGARNQLKIVGKE
jgi:hypothetical protein